MANPGRLKPAERVSDRLGRHASAGSPVDRLQLEDRSAGSRCEAMNGSDEITIKVFRTCGAFQIGHRHQRDVVVGIQKPGEILRQVALRIGAEQSRRKGVSHGLYAWPVDAYGLRKVETQTDQRIVAEACPFRRRGVCRIGKDEVVAEAFAVDAHRGLARVFELVEAPVVVKQ